MFVCSFGFPSLLKELDGPSLHLGLASVGLGVGTSREIEVLRGWPNILSLQARSQAPFLQGSRSPAKGSSRAALPGILARHVYGKEYPGQLLY